MSGVRLWLIDNNNRFALSPTVLTSQRSNFISVYLDLPEFTLPTCQSVRLQRLQVIIYCLVWLGLMKSPMPRWSKLVTSYPMKWAFLSFLTDKQKQNNKERRYIKELWSDGSHAVHWVSSPSRPFSRLYKTGRLLKYLTVRKETKTKRKRGNNR